MFVLLFFLHYPLYCTAQEREFGYYPFTAHQKHTETGLATQKHEQNIPDCWFFLYFVAHRRPNLNVKYGINVETFKKNVQWALAIQITIMIL